MRFQGSGGSKWLPEPSLHRVKNSHTSAGLNSAQNVVKLGKIIISR